MKNKQELKAQKGNITIRKTEHKQNFVILSTYHLQDNRLKPIEQHILTRLLILPNNWRITKTNTSNYFKVARNTFKKVLNNLVNYGYIEITKLNKNNEIYTIKEISNYQLEFDIYNLKQYTTGQLNFFLNNEKTEAKYKKVIKFYLEQNEQIEKYIKELEDEKDKELF